MSKARACIQHPEAHTRLRWGKTPHYNNPHYEVENQNEPTPENPVSQHKQFKGHIAGGRIGGIKGSR
jgi:hypothetical protein